MRLTISRCRAQISSTPMTLGCGRWGSHRTCIMQLRRIKRCLAFSRACHNRSIISIAISNHKRKQTGKLREQSDHESQMKERQTPRPPEAENRSGKEGGVGLMETQITSQVSNNNSKQQQEQEQNNNNKKEQDRKIRSLVGKFGCCVNIGEWCITPPDTLPMSA